MCSERLWTTTKQYSCLHFLQNFAILLDERDKVVHVGALFGSNVFKFLFSHFQSRIKKSNTLQVINMSSPAAAYVLFHVMNDSTYLSH